jgi:hypothetical protein
MGLLFLLASIGFASTLWISYEKEKPSLHILSKQAHWVTYDKNLDSWTKAYLGENPTKTNAQCNLIKYNSKFTYATATSPRAIALPLIQFLRDSPQEISAI